MNLPNQRLSTATQKDAPDRKREMLSPYSAIVSLPREGSRGWLTRRSPDNDVSGGDPVYDWAPAHRRDG